MRYIIYTRDVSGMLHRHAQPVELSEVREVTRYELLFSHREQLRGWPETAVYWPRASGPACGIAPAL